MARGNGEGTVYDTVQKVKRNFDNTKMCKICRECKDRSLCEERKGWIKCDKCKDCKGDKTCDRFYIYKKSFAQISTKNGRKTVGNGKNKKEVITKKDIKEAELKIRERIKFGDLTLEEAMKENEKQKLKNKQLNENSYNRNLDTINTICSHQISQYTMIEITEDDLKECFSYFVNIQTSQSQLDKNYDEIKGAFKLCKLETMNNIKRDDYLSEIDKKEVISFTLDEEKQLLEYINENENKLVTDKKSKVDSKTIKNIIKFALATGMRIGEICSLDRDKNIDKEKQKVTVEKTLTKDLNRNVIIGKNTKTGRKKRKAGKKDIRYVPFNLLFDENDFITILDEQYEISKQIKNNVNNLLFCTKDGDLISHSTFNNIFKRICRQAKIKLDLTNGCNTHMTKHTAVTRMIENGIRIEVISVIVGTSVEVLRKTYAHILDDFIESEIQKSIKNRANNLSLN